MGFCGTLLGMKNKTTDTMGVVNSMLCLLHCLVLPLLPWMISVVGQSWPSLQGQFGLLSAPLLSQGVSWLEEMEPWLFGFGMVLAVLSCAKCCEQKNHLSALLLSLGLLIASVAWMLDWPHEAFIVVAILWVGGHVWSFRSKPKSCCATSTSTCP